MFLDYCIHPTLNTRYTFPRRQADLTAANNRRNPVFTVPGGGGPINPRGNAPLTPEPNIITYQFQINPIADSVPVDTVRTAFLHAVGHGLPQTLAFRNDDGFIWFLTCVLVGVPHHQTAGSDANHIIECSWVALADNLNAPATPGTAVYGENFKYGNHVKYGAKSLKLPLTGGTNVLYVDNSTTGAAAATTDPLVVLTGQYGSTNPGMYPIAVSCWESVTGFTAAIALRGDKGDGTPDELSIDLAARRVLLNGAPAFGVIAKIAPTQDCYLRILPDIQNSIIVQILPGGTMMPSLSGQMSLQWKPKRSCEMPTPALTKPRDDQDFVTVNSIFNEMIKPVTTLDDHMIGAPNAANTGAQRHADSQIDVATIIESNAPTASPVNQRVYNDQNNRLLSLLMGNWGGATAALKSAAMTAAGITIKTISDLLQAHSHTDATTGGKLLAANTHQTPDTDGSLIALHHTLGTGAFQAAAGNHTHTGPQVYTGTVGNAAAVIRNAAGDPAQNILVVQNNAGTISYLNLAAAAAIFNTPINANQGVVGNVTGAVSGLSGGVTPGAITNAMLAVGSVNAASIADGTVGTAELADSTITSAKIVDGTIQTTDIADSTITSAKIVDGTIQTADIAAKQITTGLIADSAVGALQIADGTVGTAELVDLNVTTGKLADGAVTSAKLAIGAFTLDKVAEGAVTAQSPQTTFVNIAALTRFNSNGVLKTYPGGSLDLAPHIASLTASQNRFVLIAINGQGDAFPVVGAGVTGALSDINRPAAPPDCAPLAYVTLRYGNNQIGPGDITVAREIFSYYGGSASGGSPVGHMHGRSAGESLIESIGMMEGRAHTTSTPTKNIIIEPFHYASTAGIVGQVGQTTLTIPDATGGGVSIFPISCLRSTGAIVIGTPVNSANVPPIAAFPAFNLAQYVPLCYAISRTGQTAILDYDQSGNPSNGYLVDARVWMSTGGTGGAGSGFNVIDGGTGQSGFAQGLIWQASSTTPSAALATVPATTNPQAGLAVQPTVPTPTPGGLQVDVIQLGGGANPPIANGLTGFSRMVGTHLLTPSKSGAGVATDAVSLLVDVGAGGTNNASGVFAGPVKIGAVTMPAAGVALDVTGTATLSGRLTAVGLTSSASLSVTAGGAAIVGNLSVSSGTVSVPAGGITQEAWNAMSLVPTWTLGGAGYSAPGYFKDANGAVRLRGFATGGANNSVLTTLPLGYRPIALTLVYAYGQTGAFVYAPGVYLTITTAGVVTVNNAGAAGNVWLDGLSFDTH